jgi:hypothetical protein
MLDCAAHRIARRYLQAVQAKTAVLAHVDRDSVRWGWFSNATARMHLVPFDAEHQGATRVWLENGRGVRSFEVDGTSGDATLNLEALQASLSRSRNTVEAAWLRTCASKDWIEYKPDGATIILYGGTPNAIRRCVWGMPIYPREMQVEPAMNVVYFGVKLNRVIWLGADDGSDAESSR